MLEPKWQVAPVMSDNQGANLRGPGFEGMSLRGKRLAVMANRLDFRTRFIVPIGGKGYMRTCISTAIAECTCGLTLSPGMTTLDSIAPFPRLSFNVTGRSRDTRRHRQTDSGKRSYSATGLDNADRHHPPPTTTHRHPPPAPTNTHHQLPTTHPHAAQHGPPRLTTTHS